MAKGRAARPGELSGAYLPNLINLSSRDYTIREIVSRFWEDPAFPLVSHLNDLRRAIYDAVSQTALGVDPPWQLVDETGEPLQLASADDLAINSSTLVIRPYQPASGSEGGNEGSDDGVGDISGDGGDNGGGCVGASDQYKRYTVRLAPRSVTDDAARTRVSRLLLALADALEVDGPDVQLADIDVTFTAAAGSLEDVRSKALGADAEWREEDEDF